MKKGKLIKKLNYSAPIWVSDHRGWLVQLIPPLSYPFSGFRLPISLLRNIAARLAGTVCPHCRTDCEVAFHEQHGEQDGKNVLLCPSCGFWKATQWDAMMGREFMLPFVRTFDPFRHVAALTSLMDEVRIAPERLYDLSPSKFELFVGSVLMNFFDCEVEHVGGNNDDGVDLLAVIADEPLLVQIKRRESKESTEGVETVKHLFSTLYAHETHKGMVVTTARRFTRGAEAWMQVPVLRDSAFEIELVDVGRLVDMLNAVQPAEAEPAWEQAFSLWDPRRALLHHLREKEAVGQADRTARIIDAIMIGDETSSATYLLSANERDSLWIIDGSFQALADDVHHDDTFVSILQRLNTSGANVRQLAGVAFFEQMWRLREGTFAKAVDLWRSADPTSYVEWTP